MRINVRDLASAAVAGGTTVLGVYLAGVVGADAVTAVTGATVVSTAALAPVVSGIGTNWLSELGRGVWARACRRQLTDPDGGLQQALIRALRASADQLEAEWTASEAGRLFVEGPRGHERAERVADVFEALREGMAALAESNRGDLLPGDDDARLILDGDEASVRQVMRERLERSIDLGPNEELRPVVHFIAQNLGPILKVKTIEELQASGEEGERARRVFDRMVLHELREALARAGETERAQGGDKDTLDAAVAALDAQLDARFVKLESRIAGGLADVADALEQLRAQVGRPLDWVRPTPPRRSRHAIQGRQSALEKVADMLGPDKTVAVHAMGGAGKTLFAEHLAHRLSDTFPGGVLFETIGPDRRDEGAARPTLARWGLYAFGGPDRADAGADAGATRVELGPDEVRALLARHGRMLVVLDDVWSRKAIEPLLRAAPPDASVLITTRTERLARQVGGDVYELLPLKQPNSVTFLRQLTPKARDEDAALLGELAEALGHNPLALVVAGGGLAGVGRDEWPEWAEEMARQVREGTGFGEIPQSGEEEQERDRGVEAALSVSYAHLDSVTQQRWPALGAFAASGLFRAEAAATVWGCSPREARGQLNALVGHGLITRIEGASGRTRWQQHALLRAYGLWLLLREAEEPATRRSHASAYLDLMREADDRGANYELFAEYEQLRHAFAWAIGNDLGVAMSLVASCANLQAGFFLARDHFDWAEGVFEAARQVDDDDVLAAALVSAGNARSRIASLAGEDRPARLHAALEAYDEARRFYRPDTAPLAYAMTQNNRGTVLSDLAGEAGEDRPARLHAALAAIMIAVSFFAEGGYDFYLRFSLAALRSLREQAGDDFPALWDELGIGDLSDWLDDEDTGG